MSVRRIFMVTIILVCVFASCAKRTKEGVYVHEELKGQYLEFLPESKFRMDTHDKAVGGRFDIANGAVTLSFDNGTSAQLKDLDDCLVESTGDRWVHWNGGKAGVDYEVYFENVYKKGPLANEDAIAYDFNNISALAYVFKKQSGTYAGFKTPTEYISNANARYSVIAYADSTVITATSALGYGTITVRIDQNAHQSDWRFTGKFSVENMIK